jgi:hypothetical protein
MAEIYLAILVVYHDLTLLLYYLSYFTVSTNQAKTLKTGISGRKTGGKKKYDKESREIKFLPQWTKDHSWLACEEYNQLMFCNWCRNHEVDSAGDRPLDIV